MIRIVLLVVCLSIAMLSISHSQDGASNSGSLIEALAKNVTCNPYGQVGYQWVGSNLNLPVNNEPLPDGLPLVIGPLDFSLKDANFWLLTAGLNIIAYEKYSLFGAGGSFLKRPFMTAGIVPVNVGEVGGGPQIEFTNSNMSSWFFQTGVGLGPVLFGLYWSHFGYEFGDPRSVNGPLANQTVRGDILSKMFAPFVGIVIPSSYAMLTIQYSPLAYSITNLAVRSSQDSMTELSYTWNKPGNLIMALLQYNMPVTSSVSFGVWLNYSWFNVRGDANLEFQNTTVPVVFRTRVVTASVSQYSRGGGFTLGMNF